MRYVVGIIIALLFASLARSQSIQPHTDAEAGFTIDCPTDWAVEKGRSRETRLKAIRRYPDDTYLRLIVAEKQLDGYGYSMDEFAEDDIAYLASKGRGTNVTMLVDYTRDTSKGSTFLRTRTAVFHPIEETRVEHSSFVILGSSLYSCTVSCSESTYEKHKALLTLINRSLEVFPPREPMQPTKATASQSLPTPKPVVRAHQTHASMFIKVFENRWLKYFGIGVAFLAISALWAKLQGRKSDQDEDNSE